MTRLLVIVEGPTEESFINNVLAPELWPNEVYAKAIIIGVPGQKGGRVNYARLSKDVLNVLKQDHTAYCSTMVDFYGLGEGFPGHPPPHNVANIEKARHVEAAVRSDIIDRIPDFRPAIRFMPYIQLQYCPAISRTDSVGWSNQLKGLGSLKAEVRVKWGFSQKE